jgi:hypothetical protein
MQAEHHPDPVDRAAAEADAANEDALARQAGAHQQYMGKWRPARDLDTCGDSTCVNPAHHKLEATK